MPVYAADTPNQTKPDKAQKPESKNGGWKRARNLVIPSMCNFLLVAQKSASSFDFR